MLEQIERRLRWMAIPNLTLYLVIGQTVSYVVGLAQPEVLNQLVLIPRFVMDGEFWRVLLFMFMPAVSPGGGASTLFMFIAMYLLLLMGSALESQWGSFRYTFYVLTGYVATILAAFVYPDFPVTNGFITTSIFLAFAMLYPDFVLHLFFILPVKVKWLAVVTWIALGVQFLAGGSMAGGLQYVGGANQTRLLILASVLNFLLYFWPYLLQRLKGGHRRRTMRREAAKVEAEPFHRCVVCERTDDSDPQLEFRYARTSEGVKCYCTEHLPQ